MRKLHISNLDLQEFYLDNGDKNNKNHVEFISEYKTLENKYPEQFNKMMKKKESLSMERCIEFLLIKIVHLEYEISEIKK